MTTCKWFWKSSWESLL